MRSWWEASATKSSCERMAASSRSTVSLNRVASARISGGPVSVGARAERSPSPTASAALSTAESGVVTVRDRRPPATVTAASVTPAMAASKSQ